MSKPYIFSPPCWPSSPPPPTLPPHPFPPILRCYPPFSSLNSMPVSDAMSSSLILTAAATSPLLHLASGPSCNNHATPQRPTPPSTAPCMLPPLRPSPPSLFCVNLGATYPAPILILSLISNTLRFSVRNLVFPSSLHVSYISMLEIFLEITNSLVVSKFSVLLFKIGVAHSSSILWGTC